MRRVLHLAFAFAASWTATLVSAFVASPLSAFMASPQVARRRAATSLAAIDRHDQGEGDFSCEISFEEARDGVDALLVVTDCQDQKKPPQGWVADPVGVILRYNCADGAKQESHAQLVGAIEMMIAGRFGQRCDVVHSCIIDATDKTFEISVGGRVLAHQAKDDKTLHLKMEEIEAAINEAQDDGKQPNAPSATVQVRTPVRQGSTRARFRRAIAVYGWRPRQE